ncbi:uncharacterized protein BDZ99DRAFT_213993 [Mytilinidion resinicola]|uniref:Uncharacterized protein n=1 Tax=Mytilinidion resinicola TaxID=574789 RepID=A0A6A6XZ45_9PEZI|nr:uncharacterized protein BDZ99DRAFT_213993 [Mytilinidion resinicola]KAF2801831.1 hypothetical protein BDZ99DRAFT_213993 [Mytilinidion resinicola]
MAAPATTTVKDLSGKWLMNKKYCGDTDGVLALQGIGWLTRKGIGLASVTQVTTSYPDALKPDVTHIDFDQVVTGGIKGTTELRTLDWQWRDHTDHLFGSLEGRSQFTKLAQLEEAVKQVEGKKERRHVRRVVVRKGKEVKRILLVFDWVV